MLARTIAVLLLAFSAASAQEVKPKLGPDAVPITAATEHLRATPAPDFWRLLGFYAAQETTSACSVAAVAMAVNFLRGLPQGADETLVTQTALLEAVGDAGWIAKTVEGGDGVTFDDLVQVTERALATYGIEGASVEMLRPEGEEAELIEDTRELLRANEASADDVVLAYFNQGVLTGDWDGPHVAPIGAYDPATDRVLVMDVDREWYVPYWSPLPKLVEAMGKPTGAEHGPLAGGAGGLVRVRGAGR
jgi:Phytochelatin synthase